MTSPWSRVMLGTAALVLGMVGAAEAESLCRWFGHCRYESPGFRIVVTDKETGDPLADVHALAEWVLNGYEGRNGPLMVQHVTGGPDGVLWFPPWGPVEGPREGVDINTDPAIAVFKPGYKVLRIYNVHPGGEKPRARVRLFRWDGKAFPLEPFRGTAEEWLQELEKAAYPGGGRWSEEQVIRFRDQLLGWRRNIRPEMQELAGKSPEIDRLIKSFEHQLRLLEGLRP
jgi:hypothetical protein